jgi:hypothetical protein
MTLLAALPELGLINRRQIAALAGLAPFANNSGSSSKGPRTSLGRPLVKRSLFMCALVAIKHNPALKAFYHHLLNHGKVKVNPTIYSILDPNYGRLFRYGNIVTPDDFQNHCVPSTYGGGGIDGSNNNIIIIVLHFTTPNKVYDGLNLLEIPLKDLIGTSSNTVFLT